MVVTFDPLISRTEEEAEIDIPRAADDSGPDDAISTIGFTIQPTSRLRTTLGNRRGSSEHLVPIRTTATSPISRTGTTLASSSSTRLPDSLQHRWLRRATSISSDSRC